MVFPSITTRRVRTGAVTGEREIAKLKVKTDEVDVVERKLAAIEARLGLK
jgi:hypothetical protein